MEVGLRVVRGPDWKWQNQDSGEGHVGTVVEIGKPGSTTSPDKTVVVQWDSGSKTNYRVGYQGAYDLRVVDNAPVGVKHPNIICDGCKTQGVQGMRWKCTKCFDFDLCTLCYMGDKHDLTHCFLRFETASSAGVRCPKRAGSAKLQMRGIFTGAKVVRGPDWDWGNQDGGEGKPGRVVDIRGWDNESGRSVANVTWSTGTTNVYRLGHKGKVDLKYISDAPGASCYRDHLPVLGESNEPAAVGVTPSQFKVGDRVRVDLEVDILKAMQEGHGGWNPRMAEYVGKVGTVHRITERGDVRVQYEGCSNRWTFHAGALTKVQQFSVGDYVQISDSIQAVKDLQKGHGEWTENMKAALGKVGKVLKVYVDGDLRVAVGGTTWTFNPAVCTLMPHTQQEMNNTLGSQHNRDDHHTTLTALLEQLLEKHIPSTEPDKLVREAAQGHMDIVREIINKHPDKVDFQSSGKTALQVACHQGHVNIVKLLLAAGANLERQDEDGDTALHYSAFGNQPEVTELLLSKGAKINALNNAGCSTLHVAVNKQQVHCVRVLLQHKCDVNIQDSYGDTALHDAIGKDSKEITEMLVAHPGIDFTLRNRRGFNVLHHAALKGNNHATEKIVLKARQIVDLKKDDGFAALHLAALNGHREVASTLILHGKADVEILNNRKQTPLLLAVSQGHVGLIQLLVNKGAAINAVDEDGDTCLHLALLRQSVATDADPSPVLASIRTHLGLAEGDPETGVMTACFLCKQGASLNQKNHQGKTPLDLVTDPTTRDTLLKYARTSVVAPPASLPTGPMLPPRSPSSSFPPTPSASMPATVPAAATECMVCCDVMANITFDPCGHKIVCSDCCIKMKKCLVCFSPISRKLSPRGSLVDKKQNEESEAQLRELQRKMQEMEDTLNCSICLENVRSVAFMCGHSACTNCAQPLKVCHMCRKPITRKINLFN